MILGPTVGSVVSVTQCCIALLKSKIRVHTYIVNANYEHAHSMVVKPCLISGRTVICSLIYKSDTQVYFPVYILKNTCDRHTLCTVLHWLLQS